LTPPNGAERIAAFLSKKSVRVYVMDLAGKLHHLLAHWIEHNDSHLETYREWEGLASKAGLESAAGALAEAIRSVEAANESLRRAEKSLHRPPHGHE
jgi:hypothetical protein